MKLLFVHELFGALGGAEANVLATAAGLKERGHTVAILHGPATGKGEGAWLDTFQHRYHFGQGSQSRNELATCEHFRPDVIYIHKLSDLRALEKLLDSGTPIIRMVHDHEMYCMRSYKYNYFTRHICERALSPFCIFPCGAIIARDRHSAVRVKWVSYTAKLRELELNRKLDCLIVATQFMKDELLRNRFDSNKIEVHPPVPTRGDASWGSSFSDRNWIIYAGQIIRGKGVDVLLESLARVRVPFACLIFGDGEHREYCERLSHKLGLANRVFFKGYVSPEEVALFYRQCSVVALSSLWPEPFGAVGLEAMRFGLPVVAFDAGGIREWLIDGHNGFLVPWRDRVAFAARVEELLDNKALARQMGERGRRMVTEQYEFSAYISELENLFARMVKEQDIEAVA